jgi:Rieske 2Fe-2S family protein
MTTVDHHELKPGMVNQHYADPAWYQYECQSIITEQACLIGHVSEFAEDGQFKRLNWCGEDLLMVRAHDHQWHLMSNRCLHRGATLITDQTGHIDSIRCRYHGWKYATDGRLLTTRDQAPCVHGQWHLPKYEVVEVAGLLFIALRPQQPMLQHALEKLQPYFSSHQVASLTVRARRTYPCKANWKIVTENFLECYHCYHNHPELGTIEGHVQLLEDGNIHGFIQKQAAFARTALQSGYCLPPPQGLDAREDIFSVINAVHLAAPRQTGTERGILLDKPLTGLDAVGGFLFGSLGPFVHFSIYADHVVLFSFIPTAVDQTDIQVTWLSKSQLNEAQISEMTHLWHRTIQQDIELCELVQPQMRSQFQQKNFYTAQESDSAAFVEWYQRKMSSWESQVSVRSRVNV